MDPKRVLVALAVLAAIGAPSRGQDVDVVNGDFEDRPAIGWMVGSTTALDPFATSQPPMGNPWSYARVIGDSALGDNVILIQDIQVPRDASTLPFIRVEFDVRGNEGLLRIRGGNDPTCETRSVFPQSGSWTHHIESFPADCVLGDTLSISFEIVSASGGPDCLIGKSFDVDNVKAYFAQVQKTTLEPAPVARCFSKGVPLLGPIQDDGTPADPCPGAVTPYGCACGGCGGFAPTLSVTGCPTPGGTLKLSIEDALGGANAFVLLGTECTQLALPGDCSLHVIPVLPLVFGPLPLSGVGPGQGSFAVNVTIPLSAAPGTVTVQAFVDDPCVPHNPATAGVRVEIAL